MPSDSVDRVLKAIDTGLQSPDPLVVANTAPPPGSKPTTCWRCSTNKTTRPTGLCEECRAWCAGESDDDPAHRVHRRVEVSNLMGDVPEARPTIAEPARVGPVGMWGRLFAEVNGVPGES